MNVGVRESVILECFLPSFLPCLWSCSVRYTHFPSAPTDEGGEQTNTKLFRNDPFCLLFYLLHPHLISLTCSFFPLSSFPLFPFPRLSGEDEAAPILWELNGLNGDNYHCQPFLPGITFLSSLQFFCDFCFVPLVYIYFSCELSHSP